MAENEKLSIIERITGRKTSTKIEEDGKKDVGDLVISNTLYTRKELLNSDTSNLNEKGLYELYNRMDEDSIISSALDLLADNATILNSKTKHVVAVESSDNSFKEELNDFLWNILKIDVEAWEYIRSVVKYGRVFLDTKSADGGKEWSFVEYPNPYNIKALTYGQNEIKYYSIERDQDEEYTGLGKNAFLHEYSKSVDNQNVKQDVVDKDRFISGFNSRKHTGKVVVQITMPNSEAGFDDNLYIRTGKSALASIITTWQTLTMLEDQLLTYRLAKSNVFKLVQVNVDGSTNRQAEAIMNSVQNSFRSNETIDLNANKYGNRQSPVPSNDFVYVPTKGDKGAVVVTEVGSQVGVIDLSDIDYFRNKLFAGLGVLKAYLGWEESTPGGLGDSTLTKLDERMSKRIKRLQEVLKYIIKQVIEYYWRYSKTGRTVDNMPDYELILGEVSSSEDTQIREKLKDNLDVADRLMALTDDPRFSDKISNDKLFRYVFETILNIELSHIDISIEPEKLVISTINKIESGVIKEAKRIEKFGANEAIEPVTAIAKKKFGDEDKVVEENKVNFLEGAVDDLYLISDLKELIKEYDISLISPYTHREVPLSEAINSNQFKRNINEETYKQLKQLTRDKDPKRVAKSKKLTVKYKGLDDDNNIVFQVTAEDPAKNAKAGKPTSYETKLQLKDLAKLMLDKKRGDKDADLVQRAMKGDVAVSCECPASIYWGQQYVGTQKGYSIDKNDIAPTVNVPTQVVCKHVLTMLSVAPFWWNTIVRDLRSSGKLPKIEEPIVEEPIVEEPKAELNKKPSEKELEIPKAKAKKAKVKQDKVDNKEKKELADIEKPEDKEQNKEKEDLKNSEEK